MQEGDGNLALATAPLSTREDFTLLQRALLLKTHSPPSA